MKNNILRSFQNEDAVVINMFSRNYKNRPHRDVVYRYPFKAYSYKDVFKKSQEVSDVIYITRISDGAVDGVSIWGIGGTPLFNMVIDDVNTYTLEILRPLIVNVDVTRPGEWGGRFRFEIGTDWRTSLSFETDATDGWIQKNQRTCGNIGFRINDILENSSPEGELYVYPVIANEYALGITISISDSRSSDINDNKKRYVTQQSKIDNRLVPLTNRSEIEIGGFYGRVYGVYRPNDPAKPSSIFQYDMWVGMDIKLVLRFPEMYFRLKNNLDRLPETYELKITEPITDVLQYLELYREVLTGEVTYNIESVENEKPVYRNFNATLLGSTIIIKTKDPGACRLIATQKNLLRLRDSRIILYWDNVSNLFFTLNNMTPVPENYRLKIEERNTDISKYIYSKLPKEEISYTMQRADENFNVSLSGSIITITSSESGACLLTATQKNTQYGYEYVIRINLYWDKTASGLFFTLYRNVDYLPTLSERKQVESVEKSVVLDKLKITERTINFSKYLYNKYNQKVISYNITQINNRTFNVIRSDLEITITSSEPGGCILTALQEDAPDKIIESRIELYWDETVSGMFFTTNLDNELVPVYEINITNMLTDISQYFFSMYNGDVTYKIVNVEGKNFNASLSGSLLSITNSQSGGCYLVATQNNYTSKVELKWETNVIRMFFTLNKNDSAVVRLPEPGGIINITNYVTDISEYLYLYSKNEGEITYSITEVKGKKLNASLSGSLLRINSSESGGCYFVATQNNYTSKVELTWETNVKLMFFTLNKNVSVPVRTPGGIINITNNVTDISQYLYSQNEGKITYSITKVEGRKFNASLSESILRITSSESGGCYLVATQSNSVYNYTYTNTSRVELRWKIDMTGNFAIVPHYNYDATYIKPEENYGDLRMFLRTTNNGAYDSKNTKLVILGYNTNIYQYEMRNYIQLDLSGSAGVSTTDSTLINMSFDSPNLDKGLARNYTFDSPQDYDNFIKIFDDYATHIIVNGNSNEYDHPINRCIRSNLCRDCNGDKILIENLINEKRNADDTALTTLKTYNDFNSKHGPYCLNGKYVRFFGFGFGFGFGYPITQDPSDDPPPENLDDYCTTLNTLNAISVNASIEVGRLQNRLINAEASKMNSCKSNQEQVVIKKRHTLIKRTINTDITYEIYADSILFLSGMLLINKYGW